MPLELFAYTFEFEKIEFVPYKDKGSEAFSLSSQPSPIK